MIISYTGWVGNRNLGDEAILLANKRISKGHTIVDDKYAGDSPVTLLGGGTILPIALIRDGYNPVKRDLNYCFGIGVRQERFDNRKKAPLDIRYYAGEFGISTERLLKKAPIPLRYAVNISESYSNNNLLINGSYLLPEDYKRIIEFGFDRISVRGPESKEQLNKYGIDAEVIGDPALYLEPSEYMLEETKTIAVCLRGRPQFHSWADSTEYINVIIEVLKHFEEYDFIFVPFEPVDIPINKQAAAELPNADFIDPVTYVNIQSVLNTFSNCDLVIGEKLHANILSSCCYTPFLSISYSPKHSDFAKSVNMGDKNIKNSTVTGENIEQLIRDSLDNRHKLSQILKNQVGDKRERLKDFSNKIEKEIQEL